MNNPSRRRRPSFVVLPLVAAIASGAVIVPPRAVRAADTEATKKEARTHYDRAVQLYKEGAYDAAFVEFERAYQILPGWRILYNMGQVRYETNHFAESLAYFRRYLKDGGKDVPADKKVEVDKLVAQLELRVATVKVVVDAPGATITVDGVTVGKSPLDEPLTIDIGQRRIGASKDGKDDSKTISVAGGDTVDVQLTVGAPITTTTTTTTAPIDEPATNAKGRKFPVVPWVVTGVLAASAVTFGLLTLKKGSDLSKERDNPNATRDSLDSKLTSQKTFAITTDILTGATLIAGGISLYLTLSSKSSSTSTDTGGATVNLGFGPGSVALTGAF